jgi:tetratricopeptide (TPR) repeat protein
MGNPAEAARHFDMALKLDPGSFSVYNDLGHAEDAIKMWERSLEINSEQPTVTEWVRSCGTR